jgi:PilZ domain
MAHNLNTSEERRKHPRIPKKIPINFKAGLFDFAAETHNISSSGIYCQVDKYIKPLTKVNVDLLLPIRQKDQKIATREVRCEGVVVRVEGSQAYEGKFNIAVFFNNISDAARRHISHYIENHFLENPAPGMQDK